MDKWNLIIDVALCENCNNCVLAMKDEFVGNDFPGYTAAHPAQGPGVIRIERKVRGRTPRVDAAYVPKMCNHCDDAPCVEAGGGAVTKRPDGIVIFDPVKSKGRRDLVDACPVGAVIWNEEAQLPQTWFFDAHLLDAGASAPRCVGVCPTQAIEAVKITDEEIARRVRDDGLRSPWPELKPRVHYRNLYRFDKCFVAGSVSVFVGQKPECLQGARVTLLHDTLPRLAVTTDSFGDFRIDDLPADSGSFRLAIEKPGYGSRELSFRLADESIDLGDIALTSELTPSVAQSIQG